MSKEIISKGAQSIIGMVHCLPLPGTPYYDGDFEKIINQAVNDAITLEKAGVDAIIVENMGDTPFTAILDKPAEIALTAAAVKVREAISIPMGIDAAFNDCVASLSIAMATGAEFIRVPVFVDTVVFTDGIIYPCARKCMQARKDLGLEGKVKILADAQVKHSHMLCPEVSIDVSAKECASNGADAVIITGSVIGEEAPIDIIKRVSGLIGIPVLAGSGVKPSNIRSQMQIADGCIVGSSFKKGGVITNPIDLELAKELIDALKNPQN